MDQNITNRKIQHLEIALNIDVGERCNEIYSGIKLIHQAFPNCDLEKIDLRTRFVGYELQYPIMITGITGGVPELKGINEKLALLASKHRIALGLGSQRPMLINRNGEIVETYRVARKLARDVPLIGNIGFNTLQDLSLIDIEFLIDIIEADALAIHLNPTQEVFQPEGDTRFGSRSLDKLIEISEHLDIPIIVKEVGNGLSMETVKVFYDIGIRIFDVAGSCGTNWVIIESNRLKHNSVRRDIAGLFIDWGIPTPLSVIETRWVNTDGIVIASGGVWDGLKAVKNIVLGSDLVGLARPVLERIVNRGLEEANLFIEKFVESMKIAMFMIGAKNLEDARRKPVVLDNRIISYLEQRGIDYKTYIERVRFGISN
ncbi:MAG: type 2 isopentenyl-diphosphate Delta-isomerase [Desulfurococcaceae archaeon]|uniref:Isopentenyl-diphosphate delta-isomerase n=1 Tax=Staphylothermus marinus TaxID=2280 RepID=A0A7C4JLF2_STAMA